MTYFIQACVAGGHIFTVRSQMTPVKGFSVEDPMDFAINAEVEGEYRDASEIMPMLTVKSRKLAGLPIIAQEVITP